MDMLSMVLAAQYSIDFTQFALHWINLNSGVNSLFAQHHIACATAMYNTVVLSILFKQYNNKTNRSNPLFSSPILIRTTLLLIADNVVSNSFEMVTNTRNQSDPIIHQ